MERENTDRVCFVIAPIGEDGSETRSRSDRVLREIIEPATQQCGYKSERADEINKPGMITFDVIWRIAHSALIIADLTDKNPNVFYELALRHTLEKPVIQIMKKGQSLPFDISDSRTIFFDLEDEASVKTCIESISKQIRAIEDGLEGYDNPISLAIELDNFRNNQEFAIGDADQSLRRVPDLEIKEITEDQVMFFVNRLRNLHIKTKGELNELMSNRILDVIRQLYREELLRPQNRQLDIEAIAYRGSYLLWHGTGEAAKSHIRRELRSSYEYGLKHDGLCIIEALYGAGDTWVNVTDFLKQRVRNNVLNIEEVGNDTFGGYDPVFGKKKVLKVVYSYKGRDYPPKEVVEDSKLELP